MSRPTERGQAAVELVLTLPLLILALLLVIQIGLVAQAQVLVVNAAREGARAAAVEGSAADATRAARASPGLRDSRLAVDPQIEVREGGSARVEVTYRMPTEVPLVGALLGDPTLTAHVTMRVESVGQPS